VGGPTRLLALTAAGLEDLVAEEIRALGGGIGKTKPERGRGRVGFEGPPDALMRANLWLRTAERVLMPLGGGAAQGKDALAELVARLPWEDFVPAGASVRVLASARACRLYHTGAVAEAVEEGMGLRGIATGGLAAGVEGDDAESARETESDPIVIEARGTEDRWSLSVDSSGRGLHRRGWRKQGGRAPLRETVAAAVLRALRWDPATPLLDPFCGSGTFVVEAAHLAAGRAPGLRRSFAFERFPSLDRARWAELRTAAEKRWHDGNLRDGDAAHAAGRPELCGADRDWRAVAAARANAARAGVKDRVRLVQREASHTPAGTPGGPPGLVVFNPPWGKRLAEAPGKRGSRRGREADAPDGRQPESAATLESAAAIARALSERLPGWTRALLAPDESLARAFGAQGRPLLRLQVGGTDVGLWRG
jgi:putative N6-adenine-specific DNA methylase